MTSPTLLAMARVTETSVAPAHVLTVPPVPSKKELKATERNNRRLSEANNSDQNLIRKYLPSSPLSFLPSPVLGPDDFFEPPSLFLSSLKTVFNEPVRVPKAPPIRFGTNPSDLEHNAELLRQNNYDLNLLLASHQETTLGYGSEFRPIDQLTLILGRHPLFPKLAHLVSSGMSYHFNRALSEEERTSEVTGMIARGNHKSADTKQEQVKRLLFKEVLHGFSLPLPPRIVPLIRNAMVQPYGCAKQWTINESGNRIIKYRVTQDLSFSFTDDKNSVNARIDMQQYPEMIYGWCLLRILHFIASLRLSHSFTPILIAKYDFSDAYKRASHAATTAAQSIGIFAGVAFLALRLTFGGAPNPPTWCLFSEMVVDLANEIACCTNYDPKEMSSPMQTDTPSPSLHPRHVPFAPAFPLAVSIPTRLDSRCDGFIDNIINVFLDTPSNRQRQPHIVPLAIHCTCRPHAGDLEPIPRRDLLSKPKLIAEGTPSEDATVLGWDLHTRSLTINLPTDKYDAWLQDLLTIIRTRTTSFDSLETLVGRLNHVAYIIPLARHFLHRLRSRLLRRWHSKQLISLSQHDIEDLVLWRTFLSVAHQGISINRVVTRQPSKIGISDSCPFGLGGFLLSGRAWRLKIPRQNILFGVDIMNNLLEFLAMAVTIWLHCLELPSSSECILQLSDSSSALGWLHRSSRIPSDSIYYDPVQMVARKVATLIINSEHSLASQHLKGADNVVSDLLSYEADLRGSPHPLASPDLSDQDLTNLFHLHLPQFIPPNFRISPLPPEILSWTTLVLEAAESSLTRAKRPATSHAIASGVVGSPSAPDAAFKLTPTSLIYPTKNRRSLSAHSFPSITSLTGNEAPEPLVDNVKRQWSQALSKLPQAVWLRRFGTIFNKAPFTSRTAPSCDPPFVPSSKPSKTWTPHKTDNAPSPQSSSASSSNPQAP